MYRLTTLQIESQKLKKADIDMYRKMYCIKDNCVSEQSDRTVHIVYTRFFLITYLLLFSIRILGQTKILYTGLLID